MKIYSVEYNSNVYAINPAVKDKYRPEDVTTWDFEFKPMTGEACTSLSERMNAGKVVQPMTGTVADRGAWEGARGLYLAYILMIRGSKATVGPDGKEKIESIETSSLNSLPASVCQAISQNFHTLGMAPTPEDLAAEGKSSGQPTENT